MVYMFPGELYFKYSDLKGPEKMSFSASQGMRDSCMIGGKENVKPADREQRTLWPALKTVMLGSVIT